VKHYLTQEELLKYALSNGMINLDEVLQNVNMKMIDKVKEIHNYTITPPSSISKDGRWQTYVTDETKSNNRRLLKAQTENELLRKLAHYYKIIDDGSVVTMNSVFEKWLLFKRSITNSENTIQRHINHWNKYCIKTDVCDNNMNDLTTIQLESWANTIIKTHNLSRKEWQNLKTVITGIWDYAFRSGLIKSNPWPSIKISVKYKQITKKPPETQVFVGNEVDKLIAACNEMFENTNNEAYIAVIFNLYCGLRVGELVALKKSDVSFERNYLSVEREEVRVRIPQSDGSMKYERRIEEHTKTYTSRYIPLIPKAIDILEKIISKHEQECIKSDYLFVKDGGHLNTNCVGNALRRACSKANITQKSTHKIRKTFASKLDANGVPTDEIRILLGHTDTQTTLGYIYNPLPKDETLDMIRNAF